MENSRNDLVLHPQLLELLFAYKSKVSTVFKDVLGLHEIHHIAIAHVNKNNELLTFSSTPAMEFNLFNSSLWHYDQSYNPHWFQRCTQDYWQSLYKISRYDELYYLKQIKHSFPLGLSIAASCDDSHVIYSLASHKSCSRTRELFATQQEDFYKIGQYCSNMLHSLFINAQETLPMQVHYETSK